MIIGAIAGGLLNGITTNYQTKKLAKAYKQYANDIRDAADKYSGKKADDAMTMAGEIQGRQSTQRAMDRAMNKANSSNLSMQNALANDNSAAAVGAMQEGQSLGRNLKANDLNAAYNAATIDAQNELNKGKKDYQLGQAATGFVTGLAGNLASLGGNTIGGLKLGAGGAGEAYGTDAANAVGAANLTSDENAKEGYHNHNGLPRADAEDALRQIESISYKYKPETGLDQDKHVGVVAQSVQGTAFDDAVKKDGKYLALDKQKLLESTLAGCAALQKEIDELKSNKTMTSDEACKAPIGEIYHGNYKHKAKQAENAKTKPRNPGSSFMTKGVENVSSPNTNGDTSKASQVPSEQEVEQFIENNPEAIKAAAPVDNPIHQEAEQVTDGDNRTTEANDEKVEEGIKQGGIDWSKVKEYKPGEDPYYKVSDFNPNAPDYVPNDNADLGEIHRDEDFLGPDEYIDENGNIQVDPNWKPENADEDFLGPDEQGLDQAIDEAITETPDVSNTEEPDLDQAIDEALEEPNNESNTTPEIPGVLNEVSDINGGSGMSGGNSSVSSNPVRIPGSSFGSAFLGGTPFTPGSVSSGSISVPSVSKGEVTPNKPLETVHSRADGGTTKIEPAKQGTSSNPIGGSKSSGNVISNGATYSGGTNKTSRSLKYVPSSKVLPHGEERMESYKEDSVTTGEGAVSNLRARIASIEPKALAEQLGFVKDTFNGTSIDDLTPEQIREAEKILDTLGV